MQLQYNLTSGANLNPSQLGFIAHGLLVENPTNQWYYEPSSRHYIPPYFVGITIPLGGVQIASLTAQAPVSARQAAPIVGEYLTATYLDLTVPAGAGVAAAGYGGLSSYGYTALARRPQSLGRSFSSAGAGPTGTVIVWTYGIAAGAARVAALESVYIEVMRSVAPAAAGVFEAVVNITNALGGWYLASVNMNTAVVGARTADRISGPIFMEPGDTMQASYSDASTGGAYFLFMATKFTEFDQG